MRPTPRNIYIDRRIELRTLISHNARTMAYNPVKHHRRSIRMSGHDYTSGSYFVTLCTHKRAHIFGTIHDGSMTLSCFGQIAQDEWLRSAQIRASEIRLDAFVIMPNHTHMIIELLPVNPTAEPIPTKVAGKIQRVPKSLGSVLAGYKASVTRQITALRHAPDEPVWLRNYHERIIRNPRALATIRAYIANNPMRWSMHRDYFA